MDIPIRRLQTVLGQAWSANSSSKWNSENPAAGQCGVTALVVQDLLGGEIMKTPLQAGWHFYNKIDGRSYDFTESQFNEPIAYAELPATREEAFADTNEHQYQHLRQRVYHQWKRQQEQI